jgi:predicted metal-binding membrane protein
VVDHDDRHDVAERRSDRRRRTGIGNAQSLTAAFLSWGPFQPCRYGAAMVVAADRTSIAGDERDQQALSALILVLAAVYQFTPIKHACLTHCRHPVRFLTARQAPGLLGAWRIGVRHGMFCVSPSLKV